MLPAGRAYSANQHRRRDIADVVPPEILARPFREDLRHLERDECAVLVDDYLRRLSRTDACCRRVLGRIGRPFTSARRYERLGFMRLSDYARERLGISVRDLQATV